MAEVADKAQQIKAAGLSNAKHTPAERAVSDMKKDADQVMPWPPVRCRLQFLGADALVCAICGQDGDFSRRTSETSNTKHNLKSPAKGPASARAGKSPKKLQWKATLAAEDSHSSQAVTDRS